MGEIATAKSPELVMRCPGQGDRPAGDVLLRGALILVGGWFFLPLACIVMLRLPSYALGHEPIGVRFFQAWVPLRDHGRYPFLMVGFLLDLFHRGLLLILMYLGYDPTRDLIRAMTVFSNVSIFVHTVVLVLTSGLIVGNRALPLAFRLLMLLSGASLGYTFYWAPYHLFFADYHLTLILLGYIFLAFAATRLFGAYENNDGQPLTPLVIWYRAASVGCVTAALLLLKPTLLPYALLTLLLGTFDVPQGERYRVLGNALGITVVLMGFAWLVLQGSGLEGGFSAARELFLSLLHVEPAEPFFRLQNLITPGTIYFVPMLGSLLWLVIVLLTLRSPRDHRLRLLPLFVLAGGLLYGYGMVKRPGNAITFEVLIYIVLTGTLCLMSQSPRIHRPTLLVWSAVLLVNTAAIARITLLPFAWSGQHTAEIAQQVDEYARSFKLPVVYLYPDRGLAGAGLFQSAESAVVSGTRHCEFRRVICSSAYRNQWLSGLKPYELALPSDSLPTAKFVLLYADVPFAPSVSQESAMARDALTHTRACRQWEQPGFSIHVCEIGARDTRADNP